MTQRKGTAGIVDAIHNGTARTTTLALNFIAVLSGNDVLTLLVTALFVVWAVLQ